MKEARMSEQLPANVRAVRDAYVAKFPVPAGGPNPADEAFENRCRQWVRGMAEQIVFSTSDPSWGCKNAGGGRPQSKDVLAHQVGGTLFAYDLLFGVGTGSPSLVPGPSGEDVTGQVFMPVQAKDHIGGGTAQPPGPGLQPPSNEIAALTARIEALEKNAVLYGQKIGVRADGGKVLCAESGGPDADNKPFNLTSRSNVGPWESWKVERGQ
jgi:hypothetical protein